MSLRLCTSEMARCESLRSRAGDPLAIEMVDLEQAELEQRQRATMERMLLGSPTRSQRTNDPIDFFGAIRNLVETNVTPEDIEKYTPVRDHPLHPGAFDAYLEAAAREQEQGASDSEEELAGHKIVEDQERDGDLRAENRFLRGKVSELELALQQAQELSHRLVSVFFCCLGPKSGIGSVHIYLSMIQSPKQRKVPVQEFLPRLIFPRLITREIPL